MNPVRVGIMGLGEFGLAHIEAYRSLPGVEVVAVASRSADRAADVAARYGIPQAFASYEALAQSELDAISVVTAEDQHLAPVLSALSAGKHVLVEKPIAATASDARRMIDTARRTGRILMPGHILRFDARYSAVAEAVHAGRMGRVVSMRARRNRPASHVQTYRRVHHALVSAIHDVDLMRWYCRQPVVRVHALERRAAGERVDALWAWLEFAGGAVGQIESLWLLHEGFGTATDDAFELMGTDGKASVDIGRGGVELTTAAGPKWPDTGYSPVRFGRMGGALVEELAIFVQAVAANQPPERVSAEDALRALEVVKAIIAAAASGRPVELGGGEGGA